MEKLAIDGGSAVIKEPLPTGLHGSSVVGDREIEAVTAVLRSQKLFRFTEDSQVAAFEAEVAAHVDVSHALMVNSGTSALICGLAAVGVGPGDEVVVPAYTYIATAASVVAAGAVPVIAEVDSSLGIDPEDLRAKITPHTKAVIPVTMQGVPPRMEALLSVAEEHGLRVVQDACQGIGARYRGRTVGTLGDAGAWSLNFFKMLTTGEGGVVLTDDYDVYERACFASDPALPMWMTDDREWHSAPFSANCYRPSEIIGALARVQLSKLVPMLAHTRALKSAFLDELDEPRGYQMQHVDDPQGESGISAAILVDDEALAVKYAEALQAEGLSAGTAHNDGFPDRHIYCYWDSILDKQSHHSTGYPWRDPAYKGNVAYSRDMCPRTLSILNRAIRLGFNMRMETDHARLMAAAVNKVDRVLG